MNHVQYYLECSVCGTTVSGGSSIPGELCPECEYGSLERPVELRRPH